MVDVKEKEGKLQMGKMKRISVSQKRQLTIPKEFYDELDINDEVLCHMVDGGIFIKPIKLETDFSQEILSDLIREGYEAGDELIKEFAYRKSQLNPAIHKMIEETRDYKVHSDVDAFFKAIDEEKDE